MERACGVRRRAKSAIPDRCLFAQCPFTENKYKTGTAGYFLRIVFMSFIFCEKCPENAALCPSKSGLMNKHIVKHIVLTFHLLNIFRCADPEAPWDFEWENGPWREWNVLCLEIFWSPRVNDALYPSKSGLINKHTVKYTVEDVGPEISSGS